MRLWGVDPVVSFVLSAVAGLMNATAGLAMLKHRAWGRQVYLLGTPVMLGLSLSLYHFKTVPLFVFGIAVFAGFAYILFHPTAQKYFDEVAPEVHEPAGIPAQADAPQAHAGRKVASVLLMAAGGFFFMGWLSTLAPLSDTPEALLFATLVFLGLSSMFIVPAIFLWGRKRWALLLGLLFSSVGALVFLGGLMMTAMMQMPEFREIFARAGEGVMERFVLGWIYAGLGSGLAGVLLILIQRHNDREVKSALPVS